MSKWLVVFAAASTLTAAPSVTFYKDVLPIMQSRCQECHRDGEIAPMAFTTYKEVRPWAKAIREVVQTKKMPPWFADPAYGHFSNDRSMSDQEVKTFVNWVDEGAERDRRRTHQLPAIGQTGGEFRSLRWLLACRRHLKYPRAAKSTTNTSWYRPASKKINGYRW